MPRRLVDCWVGEIRTNQSTTMYGVPGTNTASVRVLVHVPTQSLE